MWRVSNLQQKEASHQHVCNQRCYYFMDFDCKISWCSYPIQLIMFSSLQNCFRKSQTIIWLFASQHGGDYHCCEICGLQVLSETITWVCLSSVESTYCPGQICFGGCVALCCQVHMRKPMGSFIQEVEQIIWWMFRYSALARPCSSS